MRFPAFIKSISAGVITASIATANPIAGATSPLSQPRSSSTGHEPIDVVELPLPPVTSDASEGGCSKKINPRGTGCIPKDAGLQNGNFLPDGDHVTAVLNFVGAPAAPNPASIYNGTQVIIVKVDGTTFPNGDAWKCITCGVPEKNQLGVANETLDFSGTFDYPQAFTDGTRILAGINIIDCAPYQLSSKKCTPAATHIYPIRWNMAADGSGPSGPMRELRKHPDDVHLSFNSIIITATSESEFGYFSKLQFNPSPTVGLPLAPRYDLVNVSRLYNPDRNQAIITNGSTLTINNQSIEVGELRGLSGLGHQATFVGYPWESCNIDISGIDLTTGVVTRLTTDPEYVDPIDISSDGKSTVIMDSTTDNRNMFVAGMRGIPPLIDLVVTGAVSSVRNNGVRRFFQPWLLDKNGNLAQQLNGDGDGSPGSINDPDWNGGADPRWSLDGTRIVYFQNLVHSPACGGVNPLLCPVSTAPGGRINRLMLATLTSRKPIKWKRVPPVSDAIPWAQPYVPGSAFPVPKSPSPGNYTLKGRVSGSAEVSLIASSAGFGIVTVAVTYTNYSDNGKNFIVGTEEATSSSPSPTVIHVDWYSNLTSTGVSKSSKITSPGGFHLNIDINLNIFTANGTLTTTVDGVEYKQPDNFS